MNQSNYLRCWYVVLALFAISYGTYAQAGDPCSKCEEYFFIGSSSSSDEIISDYTIAGSCVYIQGTLTIDEPTDWSGIKFRMGTGSQIIVDDDLAIRGCHFRSCDDLWKGIEIQDGEALHFVNNIIADAEYAISLVGDGTLTCIGNSFVDDYIGIAAGSPFEACQQASKRVHLPKPIIGNTFQTVTSLHDPYPGQNYYPSWPTDPKVAYDKGYAAVYMCKTRGLNVGAKGLSTGDKNIILDMRNGIVITNSSTTTIASNNISYLEGELNGIFPPTGEPPSDIEEVNQVGIVSDNSHVMILENSITSALEGIYAYQTRGDIIDNTIDVGSDGRACVELANIKILTVEDNTLDNGRFGVFGYGLEEGSLFIEYNVFNRAGFGGRSSGIALYGEFAGGTIIENDIYLTIDATASGPFNSGIVLSKIQNFLLEENDIIYTSNAFSTANQHRGIYLSNSTNNYLRWNDFIGHSTSNESSGILSINSIGNTYFCNTTEDNEYGMRFAGDHGTSNLIANPIQTNATGLQLDAPTWIGMQYLRGNTWEGSFATWGAFVNGSNSGDINLTASRSQFTVETNGGTNGWQLPPTIGPATVVGIWFTQAEGNVPTCVTNAVDSTMNIDTLVMMIRDIPSFDDYDDEMTWMFKADLFNILLEDTSLLSNTVLDSFFTAEEGTALGKLLISTDTLFTYYNDEANATDSLAMEMSRINIDVVIIDSTLNTNPADSNALRTLRALKVDTLTGCTNLWADYLHDADSITMDAWERNVDILDTLTTRGGIEDDYLDAMLVVGTMRLGETISTSDSSLLRSIANQCLWEGGTAIGLAEMMIDILGDTITLDYFECASSSPLVILDEDFEPVQGELTVYPNPTEGQIDLTATSVITEVAVYDVNGRMQFKVKPHNVSSRIDISHLAAGVYWISANIDGEEVPVSRKIVLVK